MALPSLNLSTPTSQRVANDVATSFGGSSFNAGTYISGSGPSISTGTGGKSTWLVPVALVVLVLGIVWLVFPKRKKRGK